MAVVFGRFFLECARPSLPGRVESAPFHTVAFPGLAADDGCPAALPIGQKSIALRCGPLRPVARVQIPCRRNSRPAAGARILSRTPVVSALAREKFAAAQAAAQASAQATAQAAAQRAQERDDDDFLKTAVQFLEARTKAVEAEIEAGCQTIRDLQGQDDSPVAARPLVRSRRPADPHPIRARVEARGMPDWESDALADPPRVPTRARLEARDNLDASDDDLTNPSPSTSPRPPDSSFHRAHPQHPPAQESLADPERPSPAVSPENYPEYWQPLLASDLRWPARSTVRAAASP